MSIHITAFFESNNNHFATQRLFQQHFQINSNTTLPSVYASEPEDDSRERKNHS
jgi:chromosome segregation and condensation protein ScpB